MKSVFGIRCSTPRSASEISSSQAAFSGVSGDLIEAVSTERLSISFVARSQAEVDESYLVSGLRVIAVIGKIFHKRFPNQIDLLAAILNEISNGKKDLVAESFGEFVLVYVDQEGDELTLVSDVLSIRPIFCYENDGDFLFGSDAWQVLRLGWLPRELNLDALCAWILFDHVIGNQSIIAGLDRLPPASSVFVADNGVHHSSYRDFHIGRQHSQRGELIDKVGSAVSNTCELIVAREGRLNCFLSGGYDSRYLLCVLNELGSKVQPYTVRYDSAEADASQAVLDAIRMNGVAVDVPHSVLDLHDDNPFYFAPWGFPAWKFVTEVPVRRFGLQDTLVDGLMGDELIRGYDYEDTVNELIAKHGVGEGMLRSYTFTEPHAFDSNLAGRIRARVSAQVESYFDGKDERDEKNAFQWLLSNRKSTCHTTNHMYNHEILETVHPFVSPDLIQLRLEHDDSMFDTALYQGLFAARFAPVSHVPHSAMFRERYSGINRFSWNIWRQLPAVFRLLMRSEDARAFRRRFVSPRLGAYGAGMTNQLYLARQLWTIAMLCKRLEQQEILIPWDEI